MSKIYLLAAVAVVLLGVIFGHYGARISEAYREALRVKVHLDETNANLEALERRVKDLEEMGTLDEQRIANLEARLYAK